MKEIMGPQGVKGLLLDIFYSVLGSALVALGVAVFTVPNDIAPGGVSGLATALAYISPISCTRKGFMPSTRHAASRTAA